ncbi:MAG: hypothetical protein R3F11_15820 [Verrucomicrobiales bacterium]
MVRVKPELLLDPADPKHWRHSADSRRQFDQSDAIAFPGGALDDGDSDSLPALMEYLLDGDDADGSDPGTRFAAYFGAFDDGTFPAIIVQRRTAADCGFVSANTPATTSSGSTRSMSKRSSILPRPASPRSSSARQSRMNRGSGSGSWANAGRRANSPDYRWEFPIYPAQRTLGIRIPIGVQTRVCGRQHLRDGPARIFKPPQSDRIKSQLLWGFAFGRPYRRGIPQPRSGSDCRAATGFTILMSPSCAIQIAGDPYHDRPVAIVEVISDSTRDRQGRS